MTPPWHALSLLNKYFLGIESRIPTLPEGVFLDNRFPIYIDPSCHIEPGVFIKGPCYLGPKTQVRHGAYLRGHVITGKECVIGHCSEVKNSIFLQGAKAAHFAYVGDSLLGAHVNLGAGVRCANFRLDQSNIFIRWEDKIIDTQRTKLGAIIGDHVQVGCNTVLNPGTLIGPRSQISPCLSISSVIGPNEKITTSHKKV
jgi:UDP-N-acetylglucosamine diphosphorylase / glucose-1-phosphate thymidylyltransferase / UDP-N-acetylgalactosamine diphosphorylase / glucosamine-1-phosphate N-acetyltransferase / galactosamine-1-phosphate N-acetyltransferase